jgi:hypothetical protein
MNGHLPNDGADIHPWMPTQLHVYLKPNGNHAPRSPLGSACVDQGFSIHDREQVYAEMQRVQKEINFKKE